MLLIDSRIDPPLFQSKGVGEYKSLITEPTASFAATQRAAGSNSRYPERFSAFREPSDRQAFPRLIALGSSVAKFTTYNHLSSTRGLGGLSVEPLLVCLNIIPNS